VQVFNSAGELVWSQKEPLTSAAGLSLSSRELMPTATGNGLKIQYGSGATDFVYWNGLNNSGAAVSNGTYMIQVTQDSPGAAKKIYTDSVTVLLPNERVFDSIVLSSNPVPPGVSQVSMTLTGAGSGTETRGAIYSLAGERVGELSGSAILTWIIPRNLSAGVYLARIEASNNLGRRRAVILKIALLR
jgi:hypothetical protein